MSSKNVFEQIAICRAPQVERGGRLNHFGAGLYCAAVPRESFRLSRDMARTAFSAIEID